MSFIVRTRGEVRPSTTGTRPTSSTCRTSCGNWCASRPTCSPHPRNPSLATVNPAKPVRRIHDIQNRLETMAAPRTARLARRTGPDMAYLNKTLAGIAGVEPEYNETSTSRQGIGLHAHFPMRHSDRAA